MTQRFFDPHRVTATALAVILVAGWNGSASGLDLRSSVRAEFSGPSLSAVQLPALHALAAQDIPVSAHVVALDSGKVLASLHPERALTPASLSKLYVAAAALRHWGADHRFETQLAAHEPPRDGVLTGDLYFVGGGDPALTTEGLRTLVQRLTETGVTRIEGDLIIDESRFGEVVCQTKDRCDAQRTSRFAFDGALSAAGINYGTVEVAIYPAQQAKAPAIVHTDPPSLADVVISGTVSTVVKGGPRIGLRRNTDADGRHRVTASGQIPLGHPPVRRVRSISNAAAHTGSVMYTLLGSVGIAVSGRVRVISDAPAPPPAQTLATVHSEPLASLLRRMQHYSNNYMADVLTLGVAADTLALGAAQHTPTPTTLLDRAATAVLPDPRHVGGADIDHAAMTTQPTLHSGSGLSISSRLSAAHVVALLSGMYSDSAHFPAFVGALPVPQHSSSGQLRDGNDDWQTRMMAKTGLLTEPVSARAVAGYLRRRDGGWVAFAIIINGTERTPLLSRNVALGAIRSDIERLLDRI